MQYCVGYWFWKEIPGSSGGIKSLIQTIPVMQFLASSQASVWYSHYISAVLVLIIIPKKSLCALRKTRHGEVALSCHPLFESLLLHWICVSIEISDFILSSV